ncbi:MAG: response regulator [Verrucomicrobia bacterium]|nr:response regulator [Verrucomicrobiota bacterium]
MVDDKYQQTIPSKMILNPTAKQSGENILVVDDTAANLELLTNILKSNGYKVRPVTSGVSALQAAKSEPPDLILLDILMPDMNGYEVCQRLDEDAVLKNVPVLFITALNETEDKITAFNCGGVDYITKPYRAEEVLARIKTHLRLRQLQLEVEAHNAHLEETVRIRTREITEAHARLAILDEAKSDFLSLISHELAAPIDGLFELTNHILEECQSHTISGSLPQLIESTQHKIRIFLDDALLLTQMQVDQKVFQTKTSLDLVLKHAIENSSAKAVSRNIILGVPAESSHFVVGNFALLTKALEALLEAAMQFSKSGEAIRFSSSASDTEILLVISTMGSHVQEEVLPRFFDIRAMDGDLIPPGFLGLRMPVAQCIISFYDGSVMVDNIHPSGIQLAIRFKSA